MRARNVNTALSFFNKYISNQYNDAGNNGGKNELSRVMSFQNM